MCVSQELESRLPFTLGISLALCYISLLGQVSCVFVRGRTVIILYSVAERRQLKRRSGVEGGSLRDTRALLYFFIERIQYICTRVDKRIRVLITLLSQGKREEKRAVAGSVCVCVCKRRPHSPQRVKITTSKPLFFWTRSLVPPSDGSRLSAVRMNNVVYT